MASCTSEDCNDASYQPEKYSAHGEITYSSSVSGGKVSTLPTRECSTASSQRRGRGGRVRSASVTGADSATASGTTIDRIMCWTMCTLSRVVSYAARPDWVASTKAAIPSPKATDRPTGQWSPRPCRALTAMAYRKTAASVSRASTGASSQPVRTRPRVNCGR